jgi:hypothetical protein
MKEKTMTKKTGSKLDYAELHDWLPGKGVVNVALKSGGIIAGEIEHIDKELLVVVNRPKSLLDLETKVIHTIIRQEKIDYIQFRTDREDT